MWILDSKNGDHPFEYRYQPNVLLLDNAGNADQFMVALLA